MKVVAIIVLIKIIKVKLISLAPHWRRHLIPRGQITREDMTMLNMRPRRPLGLLPNEQREENVRNCEDVCIERHPRIDCDLGIVPGESNQADRAYLVCNCLFKDTVYDGRAHSNKHEHVDWCFNVYGCYKSSNGKCRGIGPSE